MKIKMKSNYGAKALGVYWLTEGQEVDTEKEGVPDEVAMMLIAMKKAVHLGEVNELWNKPQGTKANVVDPAKKVVRRARKTKPNSDPN